MYFNKWVDARPYAHAHTHTYVVRATMRFDSERKTIIRIQEIKYYMAKMPQNFSSSLPSFTFSLPFCFLRIPCLSSPIPLPHVSKRLILLVFIIMCWYIGAAWLFSVYVQHMHIWLFTRIVRICIKSSYIFMEVSSLNAMMKLRFKLVMRPYEMELPSAKTTQWTYLIWIWGCHLNTNHTTSNQTIPYRSHSVHT